MDRKVKDTRTNEEIAKEMLNYLRKRKTRSAFMTDIVDAVDCELFRGLRILNRLTKTGVIA